MSIRFLIVLTALICVGFRASIADSSVYSSRMPLNRLKLQALKFLVIGTIFQTIEGKTTVDIDLTIERCCEIGSNFATKSSDCLQNYQPANDIRHEYRKLCHNNFVYCCTTRKSSLDCEDGKRAALFHRNKTAEESDQFMLCYQACKVGQSIAQLEGKCTQPVKTSSDKIRNKCCENYFPNNAIEEETPEAHITESNENVDKSDEDESDPYCRNNNDLDSCVCAEGWELVRSEFKCIRLPPPQALTYWDLPVFLPRCPPGFKFDEQNKCVDIDECKDRNRCGESEICRNFEGSFTCTKCPSGYEKGANNSCEDINECARETLCEESDICVNTPGSYTCEPVPCEDGFEFSQGTGKCEDVNECDNKYSCGSFAQCVNTKGSYDCECSKGFKFDWRSKYCEDVDECQKANACPENKECINLRGSFECRDKACDSGSVFNQRTKKCDDINECTSFRSPCGRSQRCVNLQGSYDCQCSVGYQKDEENSKTCRDTDECTERPGICEQSCSNFPGSYRCGCHQGYKLATDNRTCIHLDECALYGNRRCQFKCRNTRDSYECICPKGFTNEGRHRCADVNECTTKNMCGDMKECVNTYGSFSCIPKQCDTGYVLKDGHCFLDDFKKCRTKRNEPSKNLCRVPAGYSLTFGAIKANSSVHEDGNVLMSIKSIGNINTSPIIKFVRVNSRDPRVRPADQSFFRFQKRNNTTDFDLKMMKSLDGPQQIEIDVWKLIPRKYVKGNVFNHIQGYRIFVVVSEHACN